MVGAKAPTYIYDIKLMSMNYVNMISRNTEYTIDQVLDAAEKQYGVRPISVKRGSCIPGINFEYVVTYWVCFEK
jgi:hypothetical protein